jgi:hypothetical protein
MENDGDIHDIQDAISRKRKISENNHQDVGVDDLRVSNSLSMGVIIENCVEIIKIKGNYFKSMGYSLHGRNFLHYEEALLLVERRQLAMRRDTLDMTLKESYESITSFISLPCYLTYVKLKVILYIYTFIFITN